MLVGCAFDEYDSPLPLTTLRCLEGLLAKMKRMEIHRQGLYNEIDIANISQRRRDNSLLAIANCNICVSWIQLYSSAHVCLLGVLDGQMAGIMHSNQ